MKLLFRQRIFSWLDSYDIYNEKGETLFVVRASYPGVTVLRFTTPLEKKWVKSKKR